MKIISTFAELEGNTRLAALLRQGSLPQSSLFTGPEGVGKKTLALLLAALANCRERPGNKDLCGRCSSCIKAQSGNHPDIYLYDTASGGDTPGTSIKIEDMRKLRKEAYYRPFEGNLRFFIIDEAEKMTEEAANCILKVLEEPPATTRIILVTAHPGLLLPTIRSRCQAFRFSPLSAEEILRLLESRPDLDEPELRASFAAGSFGRALELDLQDIRRKRDSLLQLLGSFLRERTFTSIFTACQKEPFKSLLRKRAPVEELLQLLSGLCHDIYSVKTGNPERVVNIDCRDKLAGFADRLSLDSLEKMLYHISQAEKDLARNVSPQICFETMWISLKDMG